MNMLTRLNHKLHICLVTSARLFEVLYGEGKFTISLGRWLVNQDHRVTAIGSSFASVKAKRLTKLDVNEEKKSIKGQFRVIYPPYPIYMLSRLFLSLLYFMKIVSINFRNSIELIHVQDTGYAGLASILAGKILGIPVIVSSHGIRHKTIESKIRGKIARLLLKFEYSLDVFVVKNADCTIALNPDIKNYFAKITGRKIECVPTTIKIRNFQYSKIHRDSIRKEFAIDEHVIVVGFVGRLAPEKNIHMLLSSFADVSKNSSIKLMIVGTGTLEDDLKSYVIQTGISNKVIFCGLRNDVEKILSSLDIFVLPSYTEGFSTALLEAMTSGRAIICSDIPANRELIKHNQEGLLFNPYNQEELTRAIQQLLDNDYLRKELGLRATKTASQYDESVVFPKILQMYDRYKEKI